MKTRAVFFDFDGTLIESMPAHVAAWTRVMGELGVKLEPLFVELNEGEKAEVTISRLVRDYGLNLSKSDELALLERKRALYRDAAPRGLIPEARRLVDHLRADGVVCDIVTGSIRRNLDSVLSAEEYSLFRHIIAADDYEHGKPAPDPYLTALNRSGFGREECVVLENAPLGIRSSKAAGLRTIAITTTLPRSYLLEAGADVIIEHFNELIVWL